MKLSLVIDKHKEGPLHPHALPLSFGDNYLCQKNPAFNKVRLQAIQLGYTFTHTVDNDYIAFPMGQLETILKTKSLPYIDNVSPLIKINVQAQNGLEWDHVVDSLKPNYVFHECCHAVARSYNLKADTADKIILGMLIEEAFANTCEFFCIQYADDTIHKLFLEVNSYFTVFTDRNLLKKLIENYTATSVFKFMLLTYLHSHFLNEHLNDTVFNKILTACNLQNCLDKKLFKSLSQNAFALNPRFRYTTTEMYLKLKGFKAPVQDTLKFDYFNYITHDEYFKTLITDLSTMIGAPHV